MTTSEFHLFPRIGNYSFILDVEGQAVKVTYRFTPFGSISNPEYLKLYELGENHHQVHFEFFSKAISETGYKSYFTPLTNVDCPFRFASQLSIYLHGELKKSYPKLFSPQLSLF